MRATRTVWAITDDALQNIIDISARINKSPEVLEKELGRPLENTYDVSVRDGVAIIPIRGPLIKYGDFFSQISGATSYELVARDFNLAMKDKDVRGVLFDIDSPGGEANGVSELADMIYAARGNKKTIAYISGTGASGAYWLAAAADEIVINDIGLAGSVGAVLGFKDTTEKDLKNGVKDVRIVSSQSPHKAPDPTTESGMSRIQVLLDDIAGVFISKVSMYRGIGEDAVMKDFGQGDVIMGNKAVAAGLADKVGSLEEALESFNTSTAVSGHLTTKQEGAMPKHVDEKNVAVVIPAITAAHIKEDHPNIAAELYAVGATNERLRINSILTCDESAGRQELAVSIATETDLSLDSAVKLLGNSPVKAASDKSDFQAAMSNEDNPNVGLDGQEVVVNVGNSWDAAYKKVGK